MHKQIYEIWKKVGLNYFWGDLFDSRFFIADLISKKKFNLILDIGCGAGVLLHYTNADMKVGLDFSFDSLKKAKELEQEMELIQGDAKNLPFRDNLFPAILAIHIISAFNEKEEWIKVSNEIKRVSSTKCFLILAGANRQSRHFRKTHTFESRKAYLSYRTLEELFNDFEISLEGYGPHSKLIMYPFRIIYHIPDKLPEVLMLEKLLYWFLKSKRYLKNGRSYVMICRK